MKLSPAFFSLMASTGSLRAGAASVRAQLTMSRHNIDDFWPVIVIPLLAFATIALFTSVHRPDLYVHAVVASTLMTIGHMGFYVSGDVVGNDRDNSLLDISIASPTPYFVILYSRVMVYTCIGLLGFFETVFILKYVFGQHFYVEFPYHLALTLAATVFSASGLAVLLTSLFGLATTTRTFQHAMNGPFYLFGGILVPIQYLPVWLQYIGPLTYFYWSAGLLRDTIGNTILVDFGWRISILFLLGLITAGIGFFVSDKMLKRLRSTGTLSLT